ncbi:MAG: hypothetical protein WC022_02310, partial [Parcubacteria group bacterium]
GLNWTFVYSEAVTAGTTAALCNAYAVTMSTAGAETLTYSSGTGTNTVVCTDSATVNSGETVTSGLNYTLGTIADSTGTQPLASISGKAVVNNSTQGIAYNCDTLRGSNSLYYDADNPSGSLLACISGGTSTVTLTTGVTVSTDWGAGNSLKNDGAQNHYADIPVPSAVTPGNMHAEFNLHTGGTLPTVGLWDMFDWTNGPTAIYAQIQKTTGNAYRLKITYINGTTSVGYNTPSGTYSTMDINTTYHIIVDASATTGQLSASFLGTSSTSTGQTVSNFTPGATGMRFGEDLGSGPAAQTWYIDNITMKPSVQ